MINNQLKMGVKVEAEHKHTYNFIKGFTKKNNRFPTQKEVFANIAKDHLKEDPKYYTKLKKYKL